MSICATCELPLTVTIGDSQELEDDHAGDSVSMGQETTVPDDIRMECGCHFHWQCLIDAYEVTMCPKCHSNVATMTYDGREQVLCDYLNEGGFQEGLDVLPLLLEEGYLRTYPNERKPRAFLEFCRQGDVEAIVEILRIRSEGERDYDDEDHEEDDRMTGDEENAASSDPDMTTAEILRYQDPIGGMYSGLHLAIVHQRMEVTWLLLLLASTLDLRSFPSEVHWKAEQLGLARENQSGLIDIRALQDTDGFTAKQCAGRSLEHQFDQSLLTAVV